MSAHAPGARALRLGASERGAMPAGWWLLIGLTVLAAALRLSTLSLQSFWYDEAFTPVHVLHASLGSTLHAMVHTENSPPLWYLLEWVDSRVLGTGEVALRLPSALAGIVTVPVAWAIGQELSGRRAAIACAGLVAVNPLFVWYSQEARVYGLFVLAAALATLCFVRAANDPSRSRMWQFALAGALALLTHYFAVFMLAGMAAWLLYEGRSRLRALPALAAIGAVGLALLPLVVAQGGHGTQWIGRWPLSERLVAIPQYFLTGASGEPLGHGIQLLLATGLLVAVAAGLWGLAGSPPAGGEEPSEAGGLARAALLAATPALTGVLIPLVLAVAGADYLAPRNLVGAMVPVTAAVAVLGATPLAGRAGAAALAVAAAGFLAITIDVDLSPRLQRGNWRDVARVLRAGARERAITTVELGAAPLEYYLPGLRNLPSTSAARVREIDETGYAPLRADAQSPPAPGFVLVSRRDVNGLIVLRFVSPIALSVPERTLRRHVITLAHPEVLVPSGI